MTGDWDGFLRVLDNFGGAITKRLGYSTDANDVCAGRMRDDVEYRVSSMRADWVLMRWDVSMRVDDAQPMRPGGHGETVQGTSWRTRAAKDRAELPRNQRRLNFPK